MTDSVSGSGTYGKKRKPITVGITFLLIGLMVLITTLATRDTRKENTPASSDRPMPAPVLYPASSTSFGDLTPITVDHAKVRMLAPQNWTIAPKASLTSKGRGVLALLPETGEKLEQGELPILFVYNYNVFPIYDSDHTSLYKEGMSAMEWATALAANDIFSDTEPPEELATGVVMFDAVIQGMVCICGVSLNGGPMLLYFQMPGEWAGSNTREMEYIHKDLADITYSLEALN